MKKSLSLLAILSTTFLAASASHIGIRHRESRGIGYDDGYTTIDGYLMPDWDRKFLPLLNARVHLLNDGRWATNAGVGSRFGIGDDFVFGLNGYYDFRAAKTLRGHQIGAGLEALSSIIDFRLNGYFPVGKTKAASPFRLDEFLPGPGGVGSVPQLKRTLTSDFISVFSEFGISLGGPAEFYFAAGPYYLEKVQNSTKTCGGTWGGKGRLTARLYDGFEIGLESSYDKAFHGVVQGYASFSFPFGPANTRRGGRRWKSHYAHMPNALFNRRIKQDVVRNEIIPMCTDTEYGFFVSGGGLVLERFSPKLLARKEHLKLLSSSRLIKPQLIPIVDLGPGPVKPLLCIFVDQDSQSQLAETGSFKRPFKTLLKAEMASSVGNCIYVFKSNKAYPDPVVLKQGQLLQDSSVPLTFKGITILEPTTPKATLESLVTINRNITMKGFILDKDSPGITDTALQPGQNVTFESVQIGDFSGNNTGGVNIGFGRGDIVFDDFFDLTSATALSTPIAVTGSNMNLVFNNVNIVISKGDGTFPPAVNITDSGGSMVNFANSLLSNTDSVSGVVNYTHTGKKSSLVVEDSQFSSFSGNGLVISNAARRLSVGVKNVEITPNGSQPPLLVQNTGITAKTDATIQAFNQLPPLFPANSSITIPGVATGSTMDVLIDNTVAPFTFNNSSPNPAANFVITTTLPPGGFPTFTFTPNQDAFTIIQR